MDKVSGAFLFGEGLSSIIWSQDQRAISHIGRVARVIIGIWLMGRK
jgi:hypothetical protein